MNYYIVVMDKQQLEILVEQGLSTRKIATECNKSQTAVRYWLDKYGLNTSRKHRCCYCGETNPTKFTQGRFSECQKCRKEWASRRCRRNKKLAVEYKGGKCIRCGYNKCQAALDFHHRDSSEKNPKWASMRTVSIKRLKKELDKCDLVCRNCHAEIHYTKEVEMVRKKL